MSKHETLLKRSLQMDAPHRLDSVGEDDLLVGFPLRVIVAAVVYELHLLQNCRLRGQGRSENARSNEEKRTLPDSPAPSSSILISFLAIWRSRLSWFSIASLPVKGVGWRKK